MLVLGLLAAGSSSPGIPASTMTGDSQQVKVCVTGYAPDRVVHVTDANSGEPVKLRTHINGAGCINFPAPSVCGKVIKRSVVATGIGADGNPALTRASFDQRADQATCPPIPTPTHHPSTAGGRISLSGAGLALLTVVGVAVLGLVGIGLVALRRRSAG